MLTRDDPYTVIDLDGCRDPKTGTVEPWAMEVVCKLDSLTFVSPTGKGLHIWVKGTLPVDGFNKRGQGIEGYSALHYMTFTAQRRSKPIGRCILTVADAATFRACGTAATR